MATAREPLSANGNDATVCFEDGILAAECMKLMLNNNFQEASEIFNKYKSLSPLMSAGASFRSFLEGVMTFENDNLEKAILDLKETQKMCKGDDIIDSIKLKIKSTNSRLPQVSIEQTLQNKIIIADCHLYISVILFLQNEMTGYIKGSWALRKAWKSYERYYYKIKAMKLILENNSHVLGIEELLKRNNVPLNKVSIKECCGHKMDINLINRIYGSVCFGFGLFNLFVSLMPQKLLKLVNLIGFQGNRNTGIKALEDASTSTDMKAPLAMLSLLWYNTVAKPFFAVDGDGPNIGLDEAEVILCANEIKYPDSSLVLFFKGRILRCRREIKNAISTFMLAYEKGDGMKELQLLCSYEIGWCCLVDLQWENALKSFTELKSLSKWSLSYYTYITALCLGITGNAIESLKLFNEVPMLMKRKNNQLEIYVVRKSKIFAKTPVTHEFMILYLFELLYLWRALPNCTNEVLKTIICECEKITMYPLIGLRNLILGAVYNVLGEGEKALNCFRITMDLSDNDFEDAHIAPYACFEIADIMLHHSDTFEQGKKLLTFCKTNYAGYDFENRLQMRIHATEQRIYSNDI